MRATKYTLKIEIQVLSLEVTNSLLAEVIRNIEEENMRGFLSKEDGDMASWNVETKPVVF